MTNPKPYTLDRVVRLTLGGALLVGLVWLLSYLSDVLMPFAAALVLAYLLNPLVALLQRLVKNRLAAVLLSLLLCLGVGVALLWAVVVGSYALWQLLTGPEGLGVKLMVVGGGGAVALLFLSVLLDRLHHARSDRYREVER